MTEGQNGGTLTQSTMDTHLQLLAATHGWMSVTQLMTISASTPSRQRFFAKQRRAVRLWAQIPDCRQRRAVRLWAQIPDCRQRRAVRLWAKSLTVGRDGLSACGLNP